MGMDRYELSQFASGPAGNSQSVNFVVATLTPGTRGRWEFRCMVRHSLADGCKVSKTIQGVTSDLFVIPNAAASVTSTGNFTVDILSAADVIMVRLAVATGASDTAAATIFGQKMAPD